MYTFNVYCVLCSLAYAVVNGDIVRIVEMIVKFTWSKYNLLEY